MTRWTFNLDESTATSTGVLSVTMSADSINDACDTFVRFMDDAASLQHVTSVTTDIDVSEEARRFAREEDALRMDSLALHDDEEDAHTR